MLHDLQAQFAQVLVTTLLEHAGYRVLRLGIEEIVSEVRSLQIGAGRHLRVPPRLAALPDLLVIDQESGESLMVEVKSRKRLDDQAAHGLARGLRHQFDAWPEAIAVVLTSIPPGEASERYQDYLRVVRPEDLSDFDSAQPLAQRWRALPNLGACFARFHERPHVHHEADLAVAGFRGWAGNDT